MSKEIKDVIDALKPLQEAIQDIANSNRIMATTALLSALYTREEQSKLLQEYKTLLNADDDTLKAYTAKMESMPGGTMPFEERTKKYGENAACEHIAQTEEARKKRMDAMRELSKFSAQHPHIVQLHYLSRPKKRQ